VDGFDFEELTYLRVLVDDVSQMHLVDLGVDGFVSYSGPEEHPGEDSECFEAD
jgi:hypothetical protein